MPVWDTAICQANGISIHYTRTGGSTLPLILLHGLAANGPCWTPLARALQGVYDIIMPDARGPGKSSAPAHGYWYEDHANDVLGLIQALRLRHPVLIGHSMGGMTAAVVASHNPGLLRGLVLADPTFLSAEAQHEVYGSAVFEQHRRILGMSLEESVAEARAKHPARSPELVELLSRARLQTSMSAFEVLTPPNPDYRDLVSSIEVPALIVIGDRGVVSRATAAELQAHNPRLKVELVPNAGHGIHYDQPERFAAVVKSFLSTLG